MEKSLTKLEDLFLEPISLLMLPPRNEDWTKYAIQVAKQLPTASVFYGVRHGKNTSTKQLEHHSRPESLLSNLSLAYHNKSSSQRVTPFSFSSYSHLPFQEDTFDLAITQTPEATDVMLYLAYQIHKTPNGLFRVLKPNSYWIHMTSSITLEEESYPYFNQLTKSSPENFENPLLRNIFGKNGWRLTEKEKQRIEGNETLGETITGANSWMLYQRREELSEAFKKIQK